MNLSFEFLEYLQPIGIKTAYRKRALETHPDRAKVLGSFDRDLNTEFIDVQQAYEKLLLFVETNNGSNVSPFFNDFKARQAPIISVSGKFFIRLVIQKHADSTRADKKKATTTKDAPIKKAKAITIISTPVVSRKEHL